MSSAAAGAYGVGVRRALVTGAGGRVGSAIASELAAAGAEVCVAVNHSVAGGEATRARIEDAGGSAFVVSADITTPEGRAHLVEAVRSRWDSLDVLVHNASAFEAVPFEHTTPAQLDAMLGVHVVAPFLLSSALLDLLRRGGGARGAEQGEGGLVVAMLDIGADRPLKGYAAYSVSKAGLAMLVKAMAVELAPAVRAVGISPGQVMWPEEYDAALRAKLAARVPMGRVGSPADVARLVRFLATEAPYLNGVIVPVDGGLSVRY